MQSRDTQEIYARIQKVLQRQKLPIFLCVVLVLVPVILYNQLAVPTWEASTMLVFEEFPGPVPTDADYASKDILLSNRLEEITSYAFAEDIVKVLSDSALAKIELPKNPEPGFDKRKFIITTVQEAITAAPLRNSNVVSITVQLASPSLAVAVADNAGKVLQDRNYRSKQAGASGVRRFIEDQVERYRSQLDQSEQELKVFKERNQISSFDSQSQEILRRATEAEVLYNAAKANRGASEERLATVQKKMATSRKDLVPSVTDISSPYAQKLKDKLVDLQAQYMELKVQDYPANHPKMLQLEQDIAQAKKSLVEQATKVAGGENIMDPLAQMGKYAADTISLQIEIESLRAQEAALKRIIDEYNVSLHELPGKEFDLVRLTRDKEVNNTIYSMLLQRLEETKISEAEKIPGIRIIDHAIMPDSPVTPRKKLNLALGLMLGLIGGASFGFIRESTRNSIESSQELEAMTGWPVLATVPRIDKTSRAKGDPAAAAGNGRSSERRVQRGLVTLLDPNSGAAEAYRMMRTNLQFLGVADKVRSLLVTSVGPGDGKSTTLANLAIALGSIGHKVLLVDAELRRPVMHTIFGLSQEPGLSDLLTGDDNDLRAALPAGWRETDPVPSGARVDSRPARLAAANGPIAGAAQPGAPATLQFFQPTKARNVTLLASGRRVEYPSETITTSTGQMQRFLEEARRRYSIVLIDSGPLLLVHDTALLATMVDGVVFIINSSRYDKELLLRGQGLLAKAHANVLGAVLNHIDPAGVYKSNYYYSA